MLGIIRWWCVERTALVEIAVFYAALETTAASGFEPDFIRGSSTVIRLQEHSNLFHRRRMRQVWLVRQAKSTPRKVEITKS
jgi:hypothetical protein